MFLKKGLAYYSYFNIIVIIILIIITVITIFILLLLLLLLLSLGETKTATSLIDTDLAVENAWAGLSTLYCHVT